MIFGEFESKKWNFSDTLNLEGYEMVNADIFKEIVILGKNRTGKLVAFAVFRSKWRAMALG